MKAYAEVFIKNLLDHCSEGVLIADENNSIKMWNHHAARYLNELGKDADTIKNLAECLKALGCGGQVEQFENHTVDSLHGTCSVTEPQEKFYSTEVLRLKAAGGDSIGAAIVIKDITEQRQDDKIKASFIASVSHELKTPIAVM